MCEKIGRSRQMKRELGQMDDELASDRDIISFFLAFWVELGDSTSHALALTALDNFFD